MHEAHLRTLTRPLPQLEILMLTDFREMLSTTKLNNFYYTPKQVYFYFYHRNNEN